MKSGSLNLMDPSGPVLTCNGIALPLLRAVGLELIVHLLFDSMPFIASLWM